MGFNRRQICIHPHNNDKNENENKRGTRMQPWGTQQVRWPTKDKPPTNAENAVFDKFDLRQIPFIKI